MKGKITTARYRIGTKFDSPIRLVQLSDVHDDLDKGKAQEILDAVIAVKPDVILCTGDLLTAKHGRFRMDGAADLVRNLCGIGPVYYVDGNHEVRLAENRNTYGDAYETWRRILTEAGVHVLDDRMEMLEINGVSLSLGGYVAPLSSYARHGRILPDEKDLKSALGSPAREAYNILLCHHPDLFPAGAKWGADLMLSGHVHGGIIRLPLLGGVFGAEWKLFPRYDRGLFRIGDSHMCVSAGLGSHTIKFRFLNPPEIDVIELIQET